MKVRRPKEAVKKANPEGVSKKKAGKEKAWVLFTNYSLKWNFIMAIAEVYGLAVTVLTSGLI